MVNVSETVIVCVAIVAATTAAVLGSLGPELAGIIGVALGYGGKGLVTAKPMLGTKQAESWSIRP